MAAPPTQASSPLVAGLLQSLAPWMTGANPSALDNSFQQYGGTTGLLSAMLQDAPGSQGAANFGKALQGVQSDALQRAAARQQLASQNIGLQQNLAMFPYFMGALRQYGGGAQSAAPAGQPPASAAPSADSAEQQPQDVANAPGPTPAAAQPNASPAVSPGAPSPGQGPSFSSGLNLARVMALMNRPGADTFLRSLTADPAYLTQAGIAKNDATLDLEMYRQSVAQGAPAGIQNPYAVKWLKDTGQLTIDRYGNVVTTGGVTPQQLGVSSLLPQQGVQFSNGVMSPIAGAASSKATIAGAQAAAEERAKLGAQLTPPGGQPPPSPQPGPAGRPGQAPAQSAPAGAAALSTPGYIPQVLSAPANAPQRPGNLGAQALIKWQGEQTEQAREEQKDFDEQAASARLLVTQADQIEAAAKDFTPGKYSEVKGEILAALQPTGLLSDDELKSLGSYQEGQKLTIQLQAAVTKQLGAREAAQVFDKMGKSIPGLTLSPDGLGKISSYLRGVAQYQIWQNIYSQRLAAQGNVAGLNSLGSNFQAHSDPTYFILANAPPDVARELIANMTPANRAKVQAGWKQAISQGLAPAPGEVGQ